MGIPSHPNTAESWVAGTLVVVLSTVGEFSTGPVVYTIVSLIRAVKVEPEIRAKRLLSGRGGSLGPIASKVDCLGEERVQHSQCRICHAYSYATAESSRMELGSKSKPNLSSQNLTRVTGSFLLGRGQRLHHDVSLVQAAWVNHARGLAMTR